VIGATVPVVRRSSPNGRSPASSILTAVASGVSAFETDGSRYLLYRQGAQLRVLDTTSGREYAAGVPKLCRGAPELKGLSFPVALVSCESGSVLVDFAPRRILQLPNLFATPNAWRAVGRFWVGPTQAGPCPNEYVCETYMNWHTRATRRIDTPPAPRPPLYPPVYAPSNEVPARNLDSPGLTALAPCPPFKPSNLEESLLNYRSLYQPPYVLFGTAVDPMNGDPSDSAPQTPTGLLLGRCGATTPMILDATAVDHGTGFEPPGDQVGGGIVSWYSPPTTTVSAYEIGSGRRISWAAPGAPREFQLPAAIAHTHNAAIVAVASHEFCEGKYCSTDSWTLYRVALP
jgi:hypothetical protein